MKRPRIGFAGMTHLGLCSAVASAEKGFDTLGFDSDVAAVANLEIGILPVSEPGLQELAAKNGSHLAWTSDAEKLADCDVVYVAPDVPTDDAGDSDLAEIDRLLAVVARSVRPETVVVLLSQVPPGFTRSRLAHGLRLHYQVETLIFGRAMERALSPERFIVGCADPAGPLPPAWLAYLEAYSCPILQMRLESAELAKVAINCCLAASISVANSLAELSENIGADWSEIAPALRLDKRIGAHSYLTPGLGIAGGNLERDLATVVRLAERTGSDAGVVRSWIANSAHRRGWAARAIRQELLTGKPDARLAVWGLAYKENTHSVKNSPSLATLTALPAETQLVVHDPVVKAAVVPRCGVSEAPHAAAALDGADALLILTPWPEYRAVAPQQIAARLRGRLVLDPYAVLDGKAAERAGLRYLTLGRPAAGSTHGTC